MILYIVDIAGVLGIPAILFLHKILYIEKKILKQVIRELLGKRVYHCYSEYIFEVRRYIVLAKWQSN